MDGEYDGNEPLDIDEALLGEEGVLDEEAAKLDSEFLITGDDGTVVADDDEEEDDLEGEETF